MLYLTRHTGLQENVRMMNEFLPVENFKKVYVVDLCHSLCKEARRKVDSHGWSNVEVVEGDACQFVPEEGKATLVTFSYSLSSKIAEKMLLPLPYAQ